MGHDDAFGGFAHRVPRVLLTVDQVEQAVARYRDVPNFVFDVETVGGGAHRNELRWIGIGAHGMVDLIPTQHPKGIMLAPEHKEKMAANLFYPADDPRRLTKLGKLSWRQVEYKVAATYADPPAQLYPHEALELLRPLMFSDKGKVGHNVKYDLETIAKYYGEIPPGPYHDTILLTHALDENLTAYDLKTLTGDWFGIPTARRRMWYPNLGKLGTDNFALDTVARYLAKDVRYCWLRFEHLYERLERKGVKQVYDFEMEVYPAIMGMERAGFPVDPSRLEAVRADLEGRIAEVEDKVHRIAGDQFPLSNTAVKRWVMFGEGIPKYGKHKRRLKSQRLRVRTRTPVEKVPQVTAAVLEYYANRGNKMADLLNQWAELEKLRGTFIEGLSGWLYFGPDGVPRVHTGFKQHGTVTGRLSAAEPNLQQLPKGDVIRSLFVAGPGRRLIVADYDQIELRCAGFLCRDPNMIQVFKEGRDIHAEAAAAMYRIPLQQVTSKLRDVGKTQNFAVLYGAGEGKIALVAGCSVSRASELIRGYFQTFPMIEQWKKQELQAARKRGERDNPLVNPPRVVIPPYGRLRRIPDLFELELEWVRAHAERQAINAICQGFAAYITKLAMIELHRSLPEQAMMLAQVHDEIVVSVPEDRVVEVQDYVTQVMENIRDPWNGHPILEEIPLVASVAAGESWADAKS